MESNAEVNPETIASLAAKVQNIQNWQKRHDFYERLAWTVFLLAVVGFSIMVWYVSKDIL